MNGDEVIVETLVEPGQVVSMQTQSLSLGADGLRPLSTCQKLRPALGSVGQASLFSKGRRSRSGHAQLLSTPQIDLRAPSRLPRYVLDGELVKRTVKAPRS